MKKRFRFRVAALCCIVLLFEGMSPAFALIADTSESLENKLEPIFFTLTYTVAEDARYGSPEDVTLPETVTGIPYNGSVPQLAEVLSSEQDYAMRSGKKTDGYWNFKGWSSAAYCADTDRITEYSGIKSDVTVYGKWEFTPIAPDIRIDEDLTGGKVVRIKNTGTQKVKVEVFLSVCYRSDTGNDVLPAEFTYDYGDSDWNWNGLYYASWPYFVEPGEYTGILINNVTAAPAPEGYHLEVKVIAQNIRPAGTGN